MKNRNDGGSLLLALAAALAVAACGDDSGGDADAGPDAGEPTTIAEHVFGPFAPWAEPIADYAAFQVNWDYDRAVGELLPFEGRLWIGYGDGTLNMGTYLPIEFRYFPAADDPQAMAADVLAEGQGAPQDVPTQSGEEIVDRYRMCDGELWQAGLDSTDADELWTQANTDPKAIQGNVFRLAGGAWEKHRAIPGGEHVQDIGAWQVSLFAVGSGADFRSEFEAGQVFRYLWRSDDGGDTWATVTRIQHPTPGEGDTRWVNLLPLGEALILFGYVSDFASNSAQVSNAAFDGAAAWDLAADHPLAGFWSLETIALPDGTAILAGVDVDESTLTHRAWHVAADGTPTRLEAFDGRRVVHLGWYPESEEILFLAVDGAVYGSEPADWAAHVLAAGLADPGSPVEVASCDSDVPLRAVAFLDGALFLSTSEGLVFRAE
ncbi:MAG TPA: hypothetical protein VM285_02530 [Polyangia bacterium]|nr:hypothetical protein [Polyangia bacterium]